MSELPQLPAGWTWSTLKALLREPLCNGLSVKGSDAPPGIPALRLNAMSDKGFDYAAVRYLPVDWRDVDDLRIEEGDFFVSRGNGSLALVGRGTRAQKPLRGLIFPDTMIRVRLHRDVAGWVSAIWAAPQIRRQIEKRVKTTAGIWKISQGELESVQLPVPPEPEQHRIVAEIEKQFTRLDAGVAALERLQAHLRRYRAAVLEEATREWDSVPLRTLLREPLCNGKSVKGSDHPPGVPALRLNAMSSEGFDYSCVRYLPLDWATVNDIAVLEGDFFVSRGNGTLALVGRGTLAQAPPMRLVFPDTMIRVRLRPDVQGTRWIPTIWSSRAIRNQIETKAKTTAGIWKISQGDLEDICVPLPPVSKQPMLVAKVMAKMAAASWQDASTTRALARAARLRASILRNAFDGRLLTPEQPARAPAA